MMGNLKRYAKDVKIKSGVMERIVVLDDGKEVRLRVRRSQDFKGWCLTRKLLYLFFGKE